MSAAVTMPSLMMMMTSIIPEESLSRDRLTNRQTDRQTDKQTDRQTDFGLVYLKLLFYKVVSDLENKKQRNNETKKEKT